MYKIKIAIVEDDADVRESMEILMSVSDKTTLVKSYEKAEDFLREIKTTTVEVVLMDITLPGMDGIQCVREAKLRRPEMHFLMCTSHNDAERTFDSLCAGATGYVLKNSSPGQIEDAIFDIMRGGSPMSPEIARMVVQSFSKRQKNSHLITQFTTREQEILYSLSKGYSYKEIADKLFISIETVRTYLRKIYERLQVHSKVEALNLVFPK